MDEALAELREIKKALQAIASSLEREKALTVGVMVSDGHSNDLVVKDCEFNADKFCEELSRQLRGLLR